jgi:hypothetical protein
MSLRTLTILKKGRGLRNWLMLKGLSFSGPAKILLSKLIRCQLFHHRAQRLGALLLQTCQSLLKTLIHQRLLLPFKTLNTQSSRRAPRKGCLLLLKTLKAQSSRKTQSVGRLILLLENKSSRTTQSFVCLLLLLETKSSRKTQILGRLLLLLKS